MTYRLMWEIVAVAFAVSVLQVMGLSLAALFVGVVAVAVGMIYGRRTEGN